jgi:signal transduction histidine kinase
VQLSTSPQQTHRTSSDILEIIVSLSRSSDEDAILTILGDAIKHQAPDALTLSDISVGDHTGDLKVKLAALLELTPTNRTDIVTSVPSSEVSIDAAWVMDANQAVFVEDIASIPEQQALLDAILPIQGIHTVILIPLFTEPHCQSIIAIAWLNRHTFTAEDKAFYRTLLHPLAPVISHQRAYHAAETARRMSEQRVVELETVVKVSASIAQILNLDELLQTVCDLFKTNFNLYHVNIYLLNETGRDMVLAAGAGDIGRLMKMRRYSIAMTHKRSLVALAVQSREAIIVDDVTKSPDFLPNPFLPQTRSEMVVPIIMGSTLIGALAIQAREVKRFDEKDRQVASALSNQIAVAVQNARLFTEQERIVEELRALDKLKSQFMANMSHELRTPLNSVLNFTEFVATGVFGPINAKQVEALNKSIASGEHLLSLINDILDLTKIESGMMELFIEDVDLTILAQELANLVEGLPRSGVIPFVCDIQSTLPIITGDRRRIQQILLNLVSNGIKFTNEGSVTLSMNYEDHMVHFMVRDTGPGIALEDQDLIFQSFRQTKQGLQRGSGTGLGLPISKRLAEVHGGKLWLESQIGAGSTFHIMLPVECQAAPSAQSPS